MIGIMHTAYPDLSIRRLCNLTGTGRTWFYTHPLPADVASRDTALRERSKRSCWRSPAMATGA
jgi:hypothetical protein